MYCIVNEIYSNGNPNIEYDHEVVLKEAVGIYD